MNGYGERCGNANLVSIVPNLQLKMGHECLPDLTGLTEASHYLDELLNFVPDPNRPYVGPNAFAHKGGMHVAGVAADPATFEHIDPAAVGNAREVLISELSGKGTVLQRAEATGVELDAGTAARVVERVKQLEHEGFHFEAADGSFDLLIRRETGEYAPLFRLESWRVIAEKREDGRVQTEATIKIWVDGERYVRTAEGNGPVNALDAALRAAISETYPHLGDIRLVNYKVRILDEQKATGAVTRVLLDASDGTDTWGAIGVSENVIEASWDALVDSLEAGMLPGRVHHKRAAQGRRVSTSSTSSRSRKPVIGEAEERRCSRCCARATSRSARACPPSRPRSPSGSARRTRRAVSSGTTGLHLALRAVGVEARRRGRHVAVLVRRDRQRGRLRGRDAGVRRHRPGHAQPRPGGRRGGDQPRARARCCRSTSSATRPTCPRSSATGCRSSRTPPRRSARAYADGRRSAGAGIRRSSASTPTSR